MARQPCAVPCAARRRRRKSPGRPRRSPGFKTWTIKLKSKPNEFSNMLPFVFINVATTADGKLAPANSNFVPFSGRRDQQLLRELRTRADAVMAGARTVDLMPVKLGPGPAKYRRMRLRNGLAEYNLRVVVSGSGTLDPRAEIFRHRFSPILILTTERISGSNLRKLQAVADEVKICGKEEVDFVAACRWLRRDWGVKR